jgi:hypothetical protein
MAEGPEGEPGSGASAVDVFRGKKAGRIRGSVFSRGILRIEDGDFRGRKKLPELGKTMKTVFGISVSESYNPLERNSYPAELRLTTGTDPIFRNFNLRHL